MRHGSKIFQHLSDGVRFVMHHKGYTIIDYIGDYVGVGIPNIASASFLALIELMNELGLTISQKKLVPPSTQMMCLDVLIDTDSGTISIPPGKLRDVMSIMYQWLLLYVHKCTFFSTECLTCSDLLIGVRK